MNQPSVMTSEGWAHVARPSLCLPVLAVTLALAVLAAPTAHAAPPKPVLTGTNPASPGASLRPRVRGLAGEIITSVVHYGWGGGPVKRAVDPANEVIVYAGDPTCLDPGAIVGEGIAEELEGTGILVDEGVVTPDSVTFFYATQEDVSGTSSCSAGIKYRQVSTPPDAPLLESVSPASPADDNFPRLVGTADPEATVSIYSNPGCSGAPIETGTGAEFAGAGIEVGVADDSTTTFYASATLAGLSSACSTTSVSYQEVTPAQEPPPGEAPGGGDSGGKGPVPEQSGPNPPGKPPAPKLRTVPGGTANDNTPLVAGSAPDAAKVEVFAEAGCKGPVAVKGSASELAAGLPVQVADNTTVAFYGISIDGGGDRSSCSTTPAVYVEDSTLPVTRITMGPGVKTRKRTAVFRFLDATGDAPGTSFQCRIDRRSWKPCSTPFRVKRLSRRGHLFQVKAVDPAGNREQKPAKRRFKVIR